MAEAETRTSKRTTHSFAACKACDVRHGHSLVEEVTRTTTYHLGMMRTRTGTRIVENPPRPERCPCGAALRWVTVRGRKTEHECAAKCRSSLSGQCECSCGGANHGRG